MALVSLHTEPTLDAQLDAINSRLFADFMQNKRNASPQLPNPPPAQVGCIPTYKNKLAHSILLYEIFGVWQNTALSLDKQEALLEITNRLKGFVRCKRILLGLQQNDGALTFFEARIFDGRIDETPRFITRAYPHKSSMATGLTLQVAYFPLT